MNWSLPRIDVERRESWGDSVSSGATVSWDILIMSPDRGAGHLSRASASVRGEDRLGPSAGGTGGESDPAPGPARQLRVKITRRGRVTQPQCDGDGNASRHT